MNKDTLKYVIRQFADRDLPATHARDLDLPLDSGKIIALVGARRSGKTFLMFDCMRRLISSGVDRRRILYLNLEDDRLFPVELADMDLILTAHAELFPETISQTRYVFLDEVQNVPAWEKYVRRIYDTENARIVLTGSSSQLLARDLASALRGRSISFEVFPLSFHEYLRFKNITFEPYRKADEARLVHALESYVRWGGLPEIVLAEEELRPFVMEEYVSLLFYKDLLERYSIRNERALKLFLKYCCSRPASLLSVNKLCREFSSQGLRISKNTLHEYLYDLQDAFVLFSVPIHERSLRKQEVNPRKIHLVDTGIARVFSARPDEDLGHKLENVVFLHERRKTKSIYYHRNAGEIDLFVDAPGSPHFVNVAWSLASHDVFEREMSAMRLGSIRYPGTPGFLVAHNTDRRESVGNATVALAWKYLLESSPKPPAGRRTRSGNR